MKRCWIYCGMKPHAPLSEMGRQRELLKQYADKKGYEIISFTSENIYADFTQTSGALEVLQAVEKRKIDVIVMRKGILDHQNKTIQDFLKFAEDRGVEVEEI